MWNVLGSDFRQNYKQFVDKAYIISVIMEGYSNGVTYAGITNNITHTYANK